MITPKTFAIIVAALFTIGGLWFLASPVSGQVMNTTIPCGDAMKGVESEATHDVCDGPIGTRRAIGWPIVAIGALGLAGATLVRWPERQPGRDHSEAV